ncbi:class I SAM-dependent methyltransferase [Paenibacillus sp. N4]|uniref:class I SAM-dependent methyltransferase n=1 Tax=Paenibacillus vietnamensis TaxID=2590547 RepID=UPI001CD0E893|nr:class I SAM-dependent methyltransferase [Paenibacillus vietnamensis]MCA0757640.1 class I SAM-dependent methyltransferase [Paenibacillus vietnamensis]
MRMKAEIVRSRRLLEGAAYLFGQEAGVKLDGWQAPDEEVWEGLAAGGAVTPERRLADTAFGYTCYEYYRQLHAPGFFDVLLLREAEGRVKIADICCGGGATIHALIGGEERELVSGIDESEAQIGLLQELLGRGSQVLVSGKEAVQAQNGLLQALIGEGAAEKGRVSAITGDAHQLPWGDAAFDMAVCRTALQYLDVGRALAEMHRILAPQGKLFLLVHGSGYGLDYMLARKGLFRLKTYAFLAHKLSARQRPAAPFLRSQSRFLTMRGLEASLRQAGFSEIQLHTEPRRGVFGLFPVYFAAVATK